MVYYFNKGTIYRNWLLKLFVKNGKYLIQRQNNYEKNPQQQQQMQTGQENK